MKACDKMFSEEGSWFKGNLHSHTVNSDGRLTPAILYTLHAFLARRKTFFCFADKIAVSFCVFCISRRP